MRAGVRGACASFLGLLLSILPSCRLFGQTNLMVGNGTLGPFTLPGQTNHVWADTWPTNQVFERWTGDTKCLDDPYAWHSTLLTPVSNHAVSAKCVDVPAWTPVSTQILADLADHEPRRLM